MKNNEKNIHKQFFEIVSPIHSLFTQACFLLCIVMQDYCINNQCSQGGKCRIIKFTSDNIHYVKSSENIHSKSIFCVRFSMCMIYNIIIIITALALKCKFYLNYIQIFCSFGCFGLVYRGALVVFIISALPCSTVSVV